MQISASSTQLTDLRKAFEEQSEAERKVYMEKTRDLEERLDVQRRTEIQFIEERKNEQIAVLTRNHEKAFIEMKNYYHSITSNSVNLIDTLKVLIPLNISFVRSFFIGTYLYYSFDSLVGVDCVWN